LQKKSKIIIVVSFSATCLGFTYSS